MMQGSQTPPHTSWYLTALTIGKTILYSSYGLNFLLFADRTTVVGYGGVLASSTFWGIAFSLAGALLLLSLLLPRATWAYQLSQMAVVGVTLAWMLVRIIIVAQTGQDFTSPIFWAFLLLISIIRISIGRASGATQDVALMNSIDDIVARARHRLSLHRGVS